MREQTDRLAEIQAENAELRAKLAVAERQLRDLSAELVRLRDEVAGYEKCFAPDGRAA